MRTLLERAELVIVEAQRDARLRTEDRDGLLRDCVVDGGIAALAAVQRLAEDMYGGETFNFELKLPPAHALPRWGEAGLEALVEMATRTPTSKNLSLCLQVLAGVAAGDAPRLGRFLRDPTVLSTVRAAIDNIPMREAARRHLGSFILGFEDEADVVMAVGRQLSMLLNGGSELPMARQLFSALATRWLALNRPTLTAYENLIRAAPNEEPRFQAFFERTAQLLDPLAAAVWSQPDIVGAREPDFVVRRTDDTYLVIEIEVPAKPLVTRTNQITAEVTHAVAQAVDYRAFLLERIELARRHFPNIQDPECLVVIGLERELTIEQRAALARTNQTYRGVRVVGFDWIAQRAETVMRNTIESFSAQQRVRVF